MKQIAEILGWSYAKHTHNMFTVYNLWCELNTSSIIEHQAMIANQKMWNWFKTKYFKLELVFYDQLDGRELSMAEKFELYKAATIQISNYYPPSLLLKSIKKKGLDNVEININN